MKRTLRNCMKVDKKLEANVKILKFHRNTGKLPKNEIKFTKYQKLEAI